MNGVSWLLYAAEAVDGLRGLLIGGVPIAGFVVAGTAGMSLLFSSETWSWDSAETKKVKAEWPAKVFRVWKALAWVVPVCMVAGMLLPSKNTVMLITASEVGESLLASKDVQAIGGEAGALATDSLKLLRKYVAEQLGEKPE